MEQKNNSGRGGRRGVSPGAFLSNELTNGQTEEGVGGRTGEEGFYYGISQKQQPAAFEPASPLLPKPFPKLPREAARRSPTAFMPQATDSTFGKATATPTTANAGKAPTVSPALIKCFRHNVSLIPVPQSHHYHHHRILPCPPPSLIGGTDQQPPQQQQQREALIIGNGTNRYRKRKWRGDGNPAQQQRKNE
ncbi:hypothetical protein niasHT_022773 [Heterodera trifolii]|uniref:Uncharacterized protein n=1 Tax=Heterodera trifolii TaxID=157864 RepID=A0ABD2KP66_9BILA